MVMKKLPVIVLFLLMPFIASAWWPSATDVTNIINSFHFLTTIPPNTNGIPSGMVTNNAPATITVTNAGIATVIKSNSVTTPSLFSSSIVSSNTVTTNLTVSGTFSAAVPTTLLAGSNFLNGILLNQQGVDTIVLNSSGTPYYGAIGNPSPQVWGFGTTLTTTPLSASWTPVLCWYLGGAYVLGSFQVTGSAAVGSLTVTNSSSVGTENASTLNAGTETVTNNSSIQGSISAKSAVITNSLYVVSGLITNGFMVFSSTTNIQVPFADTNHIWIATQTNRPGYIFILSNTVWIPK
jgi:hypothetical protein